MFHRLAAVLALTLVGILSIAGSATAAPNTTTVTQHRLVETFLDVIPSCDDIDPAPYTITTTTNRLQHETVFEDGRVHVKFTDTGRFSAQPLDSSLPSYTGRFTVTGGFNATKKTVNGTFIFNIRGTGSDGSTFSAHFLEHFNERPDGTVQEFFRCH